MPSRPWRGWTEPAISCCGPARRKTRGSAWVVVDIVDDGPGVPEAFIDRIFEPFFTTRDDGTGYGLYLAAELLKEQSGRLTVRNNRDGGATFTIWLPRPDRPAGRKMRVPSRFSRGEARCPARSVSTDDGLVH